MWVECKIWGINMLSKNNKILFLMLAPALIIIMATSVYPLGYSFWLSTHYWKMDVSSSPSAFTGLENYIRCLTDSNFWGTVSVTLEFTIISVLISVVLGLGMAIILQKPGKYNSVVKATLIFPYAISPALKGVSWRFMLNPNYGIYDKILGFIFPFAKDYLWLGNAFSSIFWLAMSETWGWAPLIALMFIGALGSISPSVFEAAKLDGVNNFQLFWKITFPLLKPIILVITLLKTIFSLKMFDQVVTMTGGGPGRATQTLNYYIYKTGFSFLDMGYAAALACILILGLFVFVFGYMKAISGSSGKGLN